MIDFGPIEFGYSTVWWAENAGEFVMLYDLYGFFTHINAREFVADVLESGGELEGNVRQFFRKHRHLYCCMN